MTRALASVEPISLLFSLSFVLVRGYTQWSFSSAFIILRCDANFELLSFAVTVVS